MTNLRFAPEFSISIGGEPIPAALRASITGVTFQTALEGASRVEVALANENLRWMEHPLLALDKDFELSIGYAPGPLERVFVGEIVARGASFPSSGIPTLTITAQDRMNRLQKGTKVRWFGIPIPKVGNFPVPDQLTATIVGAEHGLIPMFDPVGAALAVILAGIEAAACADPRDAQKFIRKQAAESDFDFLSRIAAENGWEMFVDHTGPMAGHQLRFQSGLDHLTPDLTLKYGESLIEFSPRITNVGQIASVTAYIWIAPAKLTFTIVLGWDWDRMALTLMIYPSMVPVSPGSGTFLIEDPVTPFTAPRKLIGELLPKLNKRLTGSGSTIGDPRIRGGSVLRLEGLGQQFGGLHRVTSATHTIDSGGYRTSFETRKEIWFGSIPLPEQGALPIPAPAPFIQS